MNVEKAKERIRERLFDLHERRDEMKEVKSSVVRNSGQWCSAHSSFQNAKKEINFLEDLLSLLKTPSGDLDESALKMEEDGRWY